MSKSRCEIGRQERARDSSAPPTGEQISLPRGPLPAPGIPLENPVGSQGAGEGTQTGKGPVTLCSYRRDPCKELRGAQPSLLVALEPRGAELDVNGYCGF